MSVMYLNSSIPFQTRPSVCVLSPAFAFRNTIRPLAFLGCGSQKSRRNNFAYILAAGLVCTEPNPSYTKVRSLYWEGCHASNDSAVDAVQPLQWHEQPMRFVNHNSDLEYTLSACFRDVADTKTREPSIPVSTSTGADLDKPSGPSETALVPLAGVEGDEMMEDVAEMAGGGQVSGQDALANLETTLRPVEKYAVRFLEEVGSCGFVQWCTLLAHDTPAQHSDNRILRQCIAFRLLLCGILVVGVIENLRAVRSVLSWTLLLASLFVIRFFGFFAAASVLVLAMHCGIFSPQLKAYRPGAHSNLAHVMQTCPKDRLRRLHFTQDSQVTALLWQ